MCWNFHILSPWGMLNHKLFFECIHSPRISSSSFYVLSTLTCGSYSSQRTIIPFVYSSGTLTEMEDSVRALDDSYIGIAIDIPNPIMKAKARMLVKNIGWIIWIKPNRLIFIWMFWRVIDFPPHFNFTGRTDVSKFLQLTST